MKRTYQFLSHEIKNGHKLRSTNAESEIRFSVRFFFFSLGISKQYQKWTKLTKRKELTYRFQSQTIKNIKLIKITEAESDINLSLITLAKALAFITDEF